MQHRDHRVAAGDWMVGQKQHRLAVRGHLDGTRDHAFAGQFAGDRPCETTVAAQPQADAVRLGG